MKFKDTIAASCRYGDVAEKVWEDWDVLCELSEADYQGFASFIATKEKRYVFYEWHYGSCSGCDEWEDRGLSDEQIAAEMRRDAIEFTDAEKLVKWLKSLPPDRIPYCFNKENLSDNVANLLYPRPDKEKTDE